MITTQCGRGPAWNFLHCNELAKLVMHEVILCLLQCLMGRLGDVHDFITCHVSVPFCQSTYIWIARVGVVHLRPRQFTISPSFSDSHSSDAAQNVYVQGSHFRYSPAKRTIGIVILLAWRILGIECWKWVKNCFFGRKLGSSRKTKRLVLCKVSEGLRAP